MGGGGSDGTYRKKQKQGEMERPLISLPPFLLPTRNHFQRPSNVLHVGCGSSTLSHSLPKRLPHVNMVNVDFSSEIITKLRRLHAKSEGLEYRLADAREMSWAFPPNYFDAVIEKAFVDTLMCSPTGVKDFRRLLEEVRL